MKAKNEPIGSVECNFKGCAETCSVFRYRGRSDDITRRRFAGKLYARCPVHKEFKDQEYLLENIVWASGSAPVATGETPVAPEPPAPVKTPGKQASSPVTAPAATSQPPVGQPAQKSEWFW